ncbi:MAG: lysylphosphatidylglycerol synthase domain-containing protein [Planctomycetales bacterium]
MKWLKYLFNLSVLALVAWGIYSTVDRAMGQLEAKQFHWELNSAWLVLSGLLYLVGLLPMAAFWFRCLRALGERPRILETIRAFYVGSLGKYVPGKALVVVMRAGLLRSSRVSTSGAAVSVFLETLTMMAVGAFLSLLMMAIWLNEHLHQHPYLFPLAGGLLLLAGLPTLPPLFKRLVLLSGTRRADPDIENRLSGITWPLVTSGWIMVSFGWLVLSLSLWSVLRAMGIEGIDLAADLPYFLAAVGLAMVAGFLSLIPGGAGVREFILMVILGHYYLGNHLSSDFPDVKALAAAVILRLAWLTAELILCAVLFLGVRKKS